MKKVLFILAQEGFQDHEFIIPFELLIESGVNVEIASNKKSYAEGKFGKKIEIDIALSDVDVKQFDAIIYIGGPGAIEFQNNAEAKRISIETIENKKILAAICIAPTILAESGVLKGIESTVWNGDCKQSVYLKERGAKYIDKNVVIDKNIITANGPSAALEFAKKILEKIFEN